MLSPEALEEAGEALARVYRGIEADMLNYLVDLMLSGGGVTSRSVTAAALLGQTHAGELRRIIESHAGEVDAELRATVEKFMRASDADDMERLGRPGTEKEWPRQMDATVRGLAAILQRNNMHMEQGALDAFLSASTEAIARVNSGASTAERALHRAVRRLERDGVSVVQYRDAAGNLTVRNRVDVAVRRHVRTQIAQDGARMTARAMDEYGVQLVEVSSHPNARPSHAAWQGQVYGWRGAVSIDGRSYEGLEAATGYGSVDGLLGANCRHSFGPYLPGAPRAYERDPKHASGLPGEEVYRLEQRQRAGERAIREAKRELAGARKCYDVSPTNAARVEVVRAQDLLARRQEAMRRLVKESNAKSLTGHPVLHRHPAREWAGDMPGGAWVKSSGRTLAQLMDGKAAREAMARAGVSRTAVARAVAEEMKLQGMKSSDFSTLTAVEQRSVFSKILAKLKPARPEGKHYAPFRKIKGEHTAAQDLAATNPRYKPLDPKWSVNCQRCVSAYEARRRGYDVTAKPGGIADDRLPSMFDPGGWPHMYRDFDLVDCAADSRNGVRARVDSLMGEWGDGSRAIVYVEWENQNFGHVFIAERVNGTTRYVDPQTNSTDVSGYFDLISKDWAYCVRIDDREFTELIGECCKEVRR